MIEETIKLSGVIDTNNKLVGNIVDKKLSASVSIPKEITEKNYNKFNNKPQINSIELVDNKTSEELGLQPVGNYADTRVTNLEIDALFK